MIAASGGSTARAGGSSFCKYSTLSFSQPPRHMTLTQRIKIKRDHVTANQAIFQKIERYDAQLSNEIGERASNLARQKHLSTEMAAKPPADPAASAIFDEYEQQIRALDASEQQCEANCARSKRD